MIEKECEGRKCPFFEGMKIGKNCHKNPYSRKPCIFFDEDHDDCKLFKSIIWGRDSKYPEED